MATTAQIEAAADRRLRHYHRIRTHIIKHQRPPTPDELAAHEGQHRRAVQLDLDALATAGLIHLDKGPGGRRYPRIANVRVHLEDLPPQDVTP